MLSNFLEVSVPDEIRKERLNIFLVKDGVVREAAVRTDVAAELEHTALSESLPYVGDLYVKRSQGHEPSWLPFVQQGVDVHLTGLTVRSASALIVLIAGDRIFAVSFGTSRHWIDDNVIERRFGMLVTLNCVDPNKLHSVDREEFDTITRTTRSQTSASAAIENFGLDVQRDLVRAVTGKPENQEFAVHATGADNLIISVGISITGLADKCVEALTIYKSTKYRERYPWIDNFVRVKDPVVIAELDEMMLDDFTSPEAENVFLSPPNLLDTQEHRGFRYPSERKGFHDDLRLRDFLEVYESKSSATRSGLSISDLQRMKIRHFAADDRLNDSFTVYASVIYEVVRGECLFTLTRGEWFQVDQGYVATVDHEVSEIKDHPDLVLPTALQGEPEGDYNQRASDLSGGYLALMDMKTIQYGGGQSKMEVCDLLSLDRNFIHVKSKTKSAALSHLFAQGLNSAQAFRDAEFRKLAAEKCNPSHKALFPVEPINPVDHAVTYAVITTAPNALHKALPFFSRQSLANAARQLRNMGYRIFLKKIFVEPTAH
jgi:uncharacterized protein (TIGR04141 family)